MDNTPKRDGMAVGSSYKAMAAAARFGHLDVLKWFKREWVKANLNFIVPAAQDGGHEHVLTYLKTEYKGEWPFDGSVAGLT